MTTNGNEERQEMPLEEFEGPIKDEDVFWRSTAEKRMLGATWSRIKKEVGGEDVEDGVPAGGTAGQVLTKKSGTDYDSEWEDAPSGGVGAFTGLSDTPGTFGGEAGKVLAVNAQASAIEFVNKPQDGQDGRDGTDGRNGRNGRDGAAGQGVVAGGAKGQILGKKSATDYDTEWIDKPAGDGASSFTGLSDTPSAYTGEAGKALIVNSAEDGIDFEEHLTREEVGNRIIDYVIAEIDVWSGTIAQSDLFTSRTERMTLDTDGALNQIGYDLGLAIAIETDGTAYPFRVQVERWDGSNWDEMFKLENAETQKARILHHIDIPRPYTDDTDSFRLTITSSTSANTVIASARMEVYAKKPYQKGGKGDTGDAGEDGRDAYQGVWDNTRSYKVGDAVSYTHAGDTEIYDRITNDTGPVQMNFNPFATDEWVSRKGQKGGKGDTGDAGDAGQGVAAGGTAGQILGKKSGTDYDTEWVDKPAGNGASKFTGLSDTPSAYTDQAGKLIVVNADADAVEFSGAVSGRLDLLERVTHDLHAGEVVNRNLQDVNSDGSEGGINNINNLLGWNLTRAKAATGWRAPAWNNAQGYRLYRIPVGKNASSFSAIYGGADLEATPLSYMIRVGSDDDWQYYSEGQIIPDGDTVKLQISGHVTGYTEFHGKIADNEPTTGQVLTATARGREWKDAVSGVSSPQKFMGFESSSARIAAGGTRNVHLVSVSKGLLTVGSGANVNKFIAPKGSYRIYASIWFKDGGGQGRTGPSLTVDGTNVEILGWGNPYYREANATVSARRFVEFYVPADDTVCTLQIINRDIIDQAGAASQGVQDLLSVAITNIVALPIARVAPPGGNGAALTQEAVYEEVAEILSPLTQDFGLQIVEQDSDHTIDLGLSDKTVKAIKSDAERLDGLERITHDLHAGSVTTHNWADVNSDGTEGGVAYQLQEFNLAQAKAATYTAPSVTGQAGHRAYRIPKRSNASNYAIQHTGTFNFAEPLGQTIYLGADDDWHYYNSGGTSAAADTTTLRLSSHTAGYTEFNGRLGADVSLDPANLDTAGGSNGQVLKIEAGTPAWANESGDTSTGSSSFTGLNDTPANFNGAGGKIVAVKSDRSGLEYVDKPADGQDGRDGTDGRNGRNGRDGAAGRGVAAGGTTGQILGKKSNTHYDTEWVDKPADGQDGAPGQGVAAGGTTGQILGKKSNTDYDTEWVDKPAGGADGAVAERIDGLERITHDLHAGSVTTHNWADVKSDGTEGGVAYQLQEFNLAQAKAATYTAPSVTGQAGHRAYRIPKRSNASNYAIQHTGTFNFAEPLGQTIYLGADDDWHYYNSGGTSAAADTTTLRLSSHTAGYTEFNGRLGADVSLDPANLDTAGGSNGQVLKIEAGTPAWANESGVADGSITKDKLANDVNMLNPQVLTQAQYNALTNKLNRFYIISDA